MRSAVRNCEKVTFGKLSISGKSLLGSFQCAHSVRIPGRMSGACVLHASVPAFPRYGSNPQGRSRSKHRSSSYTLGPHGIGPMSDNSIKRLQYPMGLIHYVECSPRPSSITRTIFWGETNPPDRSVRGGLGTSLMWHSRSDFTPGYAYTGLLLLPLYYSRPGVECYKCL